MSTKSSKASELNAIERRNKSLKKTASVSASTARPKMDAMQRLNVEFEQHVKMCMDLLVSDFPTVSEESLRRYSEVVLALQLQGSLSENSDPPAVREPVNHSSLRDHAKTFTSMVKLFDRAMRIDDMCAFSGGNKHAVDLHATNLTTALVYYGLTGNAIAVLSPEGFYGKCEQVLSFLRRSSMRNCANSITLLEMNYFDPVWNIDSKKMLHELLAVCVDIFVSAPRIVRPESEYDSEADTEILTVLDDIAAAAIEFPELVKKGVRYGETTPSFFGSRKCVFPLHKTTWQTNANLRAKHLQNHAASGLKINSAVSGTGTWQWKSKKNDSMIMCATKIPVDKTRRLWFYTVSLFPAPVHK